MLSMLGIVLGLGLLIGLAYRGVSVVLLAPVAATVAVVLTPEAPVLASYTQVFMKALGGFVVLYFPLFMLGALFGKLMEVSGAALAIAQAIVRRLGAGQAILAVASACALLTYGGVSLFVVAFAVYPIAAELFRQAQVPKRLVPATIALGALPHNGAVITLLEICRLNHRQSYGDIAMVAVIIPLLALSLVIVLGTVWGSF